MVDGIPVRSTVVLRPVPVLETRRSDPPGTDPSVNWYCATPRPVSQENVAVDSVRIVPLPGLTKLAGDGARIVSITGVVLTVPPP